MAQNANKKRFHSSFGSGSLLVGSMPPISHSMGRLSSGTNRKYSFTRIPSVTSISSNSSTNSARTTFTGNAVMQMYQRSNASSVKCVIADLQITVNEQKKLPNETFEPPLQECFMLSNWAIDAYYKVVISKYQGIPAIVDAMQTFPNNADLQAYCCITLKNLGNKLAIQQAGGVTAILTAMRAHSDSIHVQSEACEALQSQAQFLHQEPEVVRHDLSCLLRQATGMYLTHKGQESLTFLIEFCNTAQPSMQVI
jgi:hypothetical protein